MERPDLPERNKRGPTGEAKSRILKYLLMQDDGGAYESDIRVHIQSESGKGDRNTIKGHLKGLRKETLIDQERTPENNNWWFIINRPGIVDAVFEKFDDDDIVEIYRGVFFQSNIEQWYQETLTDEFKTWNDDRIERWQTVLKPSSWEQEYLFPLTLRLAKKAVKVSPTHYFSALYDDFPPEETAICTLLIAAGKGGPTGEHSLHNQANNTLGYIIADLLLDILRFPGMRDDIISFCEDREFLKLFYHLFPEETIEMIIRCMAVISGRVPSHEKDWNDVLVFEKPDPIIIPPPPGSAEKSNW